MHLAQLALHCQTLGRAHMLWRGLDNWHPKLDREHNDALGMPRAIGIHQLRHEFGILFKNDGTSEPFEMDGVTNLDGTAQIEISELPTCPLLTLDGCDRSIPKI